MEEYDRQRKFKNLPVAKELYTQKSLHAHEEDIQGQKSFQSDIRKP